MANFLPTPGSHALLQNPTKRSRGLWDTPQTTYESLEQFIPPRLRGLIPSWPRAFQNPQQTALLGAQTFGPQADLDAGLTSWNNAVRGLLAPEQPLSKRLQDFGIGSAYAAAAIPMMALPGTIAWPGAPHKWASEPGYPHGRPRLDKMGTGEGAHMWGKGHYSGQAKGTGQQYRDSLAKPPTVEAGIYPRKWDYELDVIDKALKHFGPATLNERREIARLSKNYTSSYWGRAAHPFQKDSHDAFLEGLARSEKRLNSPPFTGGGEGEAVVKALREMPTPELIPRRAHLYKYDIPDADTAKFFNYDARLYDQPQIVKDALKKAGLWPGKGSWLPYAIPSRLMGGDIFFRGIEKDLHKHGVPGLRFKDQLSRGKKEGATYNYVTWDQDVLNRIKMLEIDDQPVGLLGN